MRSTSLAESVQRLRLAFGFELMPCRFPSHGSMKSILSCQWRRAPACITSVAEGVSCGTYSQDLGVWAVQIHRLSERVWRQRWQPLRAHPEEPRKRTLEPAHSGKWSVGSPGVQAVNRSASKRTTAAVRSEDLAAVRLLELFVLSADRDATAAGEDRAIKEKYLRKAVDAARWPGEDSPPLFHLLDDLTFTSDNQLHRSIEEALAALGPHLEQGPECLWFLRHSPL